ncbi:MAG: SigF/SigG family RNA polymerase sporulation sigma factor [Lachnospiraceae bacterium]|nr:SigF/SigG family RNA polymerase sporulation sigma factor [Lachnospiraceae bacterium]MDD3796061.1 SigF/SigG family RNA polymerase sporulation sigma factor [Lachnospiraceae bacterium]
MEHTLALIEQAHQGDKSAREMLVEENLGLVFTVVKRFFGRGCETEDLIQIGSIGLLKAIDKFDLTYEVKFSTYAVPLIAGEIKRFLRDDGMIKVSRSLKETAAYVYNVRDRLEKKIGREPTMEELEGESGLEREEMMLALESCAEVDSLYRTIYQGDGNAVLLMDKLEEKENKNEKLLNHMLLEELLKLLQTQEKQLISLRYFQDKTQVETARELGISQVQVSRMEKKILKKMRGDAAINQ